LRITASACRSPDIAPGKPSTRHGRHHHPVSTAAIAMREPHRVTIQP
jgi:hypothetical protein